MKPYVYIAEKDVELHKKQVFLQGGMNEKRKNNNDKKVFCLGSGICGSCIDADSAGTVIVCSRWQSKNGGSHKPAGKTAYTQKG